MSCRSIHHKGDKEMTQTTNLHDQVHNITELTNVLTTLISDRALCDSGITCELFFRYVDAVKHHLQNTESGLFAQLLVDSDNHQSKVVDQFMSGSHEIKQIFSDYSKKWCKDNELRISNYSAFLKESTEMFDLVLRRLQDETEKLYPLLQQGNTAIVQQHSAAVA